MSRVTKIKSFLARAHGHLIQANSPAAAFQIGQCPPLLASQLPHTARFHNSSTASLNASMRLCAPAAQETIHAAHPPGPPEQRRLHWTVLLLPAALAAFLGTWQVGRQKWKVEQVQQRETGLKAEPVAVSQASEALPEYRRVWCQGELQHERSIFVGPRPRTIMGSAKPGYVLVTPLVNKEWGHAVLVNRGWVPAEWKTDAQLRASGCPLGKVHMEGVMRESENPSSFVPANIPAKGEWYWLDVPGMARAAGLPSDAPMMEVVRREGPEASQVNVPTAMEVLAGRTRGPSAAQAYPVPRSMEDLAHFPVMPSDHRNYALTWYSLSAATALLALRAARTR
ncbi:hypothetical protein CVIRNUC_010075 [Coccomyxa viridis]|uniref:SURF1-like protein n=1 Tax=Coccomyxa viridis TaxID=1274662 RepID=A0AAV1IJN6_9CHLO|nr:hypothetical protein CVIRNUC_010075 [Coccomyxa viridis]